MPNAYLLLYATLFILSTEILTNSDFLIPNQIIEQGVSSKQGQSVAGPPQTPASTTGSYASPRSYTTSYPAQPDSIITRTISSPTTPSHSILFIIRIFLK